MSILRRHLRRAVCHAALVAGALAILLIAGACGSDDGSAGQGAAGFQKVTATDHVYTIDDMLAAGFRKSSQYDIEGLPEATGAWYGFWGPDPYNRKEYEVRFYASHQDAVDHGAALADEVTGTDTLRANKDSLTWEGGKREWWIRTSVIGIIGGAGAQNTARYADFAIFGNIVMLCEGQDSSVSLEACEGLVNLLRESVRE